MLAADVRALLEARLPDDRLSRLRQVQRLAAQLGLRTYLVGGFVRDLLLGLPPGDFDFVVEPLQAASDPMAGPRIARALADEVGGQVTVHAAFGTATWREPQGVSVDIATARTEHYPWPGALPRVSPSASILDDLSRRDFTVNAMAARVDGEAYGNLLDPYRGQADLKARRIAVLHPRSLVDDPTRVFRAVRYAGRLDFQVAAETLAQVPEALSIVASLSGERVRHELELLFLEANAAAMLARLDDLHALKALHPALGWGPAETGRAAVIPRLPLDRWNLSGGLDRNSLCLALLLRRADPAAVAAALRRLAVSREVLEAVNGALALPVAGAEWRASPSAVVAHLEGLGEGAVVAAYVLYPDERELLDQYLAEWRFVRAQTTGDDLLALGLAPGPQFKRILWSVRAARLDGVVSDRAGELALIRGLVDTE
jgi:tRNA nucleotidyltransferase (CCA-adding enzyme)